MARQMHCLLVGVGLVWFASGCAPLDLFSGRLQSPDVTDTTNAKLVADLAVPFGDFPVTVESVALVSCLPGTGSDPAPSPQRALLMADMKARGVEHPSRVLASKQTALVLVRGVLPPGIQKGDPFDIEVRVPSQSETTSLRGGWLLRTRLKEMKILDDQQVHGGRDWGIAEGPVLVDPSAEDRDDPVLACRGRILGGGRALQGRSLGLVLKPGHQNVFNAARAETAINKRFYSVSPGGVQEGMAKAISDEYIELAVHPRYKHNISRYMAVARAIALGESSAARIERTALLEKQLLDPITSQRAALELEAIGRQGVDVLTKGMKSDDTEIRFRSAEALAYLDVSEAAKPLGDAAREEPAFRVFALAALATMNDPMAYEQLCGLLDSPSAETRYGAFRALWTMNPMDSRVMGEQLGESFAYHVLPSTAAPMIHVARSRRAELVLFGQDQRFTTPLLLEAGPKIRVMSDGGDEIAVSRFEAGQPDQKRVVSSRVDDVVRAIAELGGTYPDAVQALQQARQKGALTSRLEVDALPEAGRRYERTAGVEENEEEDNATAKHSPFSLFSRRKPRAPANEGGAAAAATPRESDDAHSARQTPG